MLQFNLKFDDIIYEHAIKQENADLSTQLLTVTL